MDKNEAKALLAKRQKMFDDVANFVPQKTTPILENLFKWKFFDTEIEPKPTPWEFLTNWDLMEKVVREHQERYSPDLGCDIGNRNNMGINIALGHSQHQMIDQEQGIIEAVDENRLPDVKDLLEIQKNQTEYAWTKASSVTFPDGLTYGQIQDACKAVNDFNNFVAKMQGILNEEYGVPTMVKGQALAPLEFPAMYYRGFKEFSLDMRRSPEVLDEYNARVMPGMLKTIAAHCDAPRGNFAYEEWGVFLVHSLMNAKQFERFMWNGVWKDIYEVLAEKKGKTILFIEAAGLRLADFLNDVPRGVITCYWEQDDPFAMRNAMPNVAFAYYPTEYLFYRSKEEAVDMAKKLVEGMGPGYMFSTNKMIEHVNDQKRENIMAVYDYLRNH